MEKNGDSIHIRNRSAIHPAGRESYPKTAQSAIATHTYQEAVRRWWSQLNMFRNPTCIMVDTCLEQVSIWHNVWVDIHHKNHHHLTYEPSYNIVKSTQHGLSTMAEAQSKSPMFSVHSSCISMVTLDPLECKRAGVWFENAKCLSWNFSILYYSLFVSERLSETCRVGDSQCIKIYLG